MKLPIYLERVGMQLAVTEFAHGQSLKIKSPKKKYYFNVHFDHQGVIARKESGKLMVKKIKEIAGEFPVISTGDYNSHPDTEQIQLLSVI